MALTQPLSAREELIADVVERVSPAIVNIRTEESFGEIREKGGSIIKRILRQEPEEQASENLGSGVVIDPKGIVVTNEHLVSKAVNIIVKFIDGREYEAQVIATDPDLDIALLKIMSEELFPCIKVENKKLRIGQRVVAIGNPYGLSSSVTQGVISAIGRNLRIEGRVYTNLIQTDAAINPGNSGGALLDLDGNPVGIVTAIYGEGKGIGFAIPMEEVMQMVKEFVKEEGRRPILGIVFEKMKDLSGYYIYVKATIEGSPAEKYGLKKGDKLVRIDSYTIREGTKMHFLIKKIKERDKIKLKVLRNGKLYDISIDANEAYAYFPSPLDKILCGIRTTKIGSYQRLRYKLKEKEGLIVTKVFKERTYFRSGLEAGDIIVGINNNPVKTKEDFEKHLLNGLKRNYVLFHIKRNGEASFIPLKFDTLL